MRRIILLLLIIVDFGFACSGDCISCHPNLLKSGKLDNNHKILSKCIKCHKINSNDLEKMGSLCGQDCWDCHSVEKTKKVINDSHMALDSCISCHTKLDNKPFGLKMFVLQ